MKRNHIYRYRLGTLATVCPQCGRRRFKPYVRSSDGTVVHPACGRCNREFSCGYHLRPAELFAQRGYADTHISLASRSRSVMRPAIDTVAESTVAATMLRSPWGEPVHALLARTFGMDTASAVVADYRFAAGWLHRRKAALYWLIDTCGRTRSGKLMLYDTHAHRLRHSRLPSTSYVHTLLRPGFRYEACYFGAHLLPRHSAARVLVVESEKTALFMACLLRRQGLWGRYIALATGGCSALATDTARMRDTYYRGRDLARRHIVLAPDADATDKWAEAADRLRTVCATVRLLDLRSLAAEASDDPMDIALRSPDAVIDAIAALRY